jgi:hypothetical protein
MHVLTLRPIKTLTTDNHSLWHYYCHWIPAQLTGMELEVLAQRSGPVQDHQIRLQLDGEPVGENRAGQGGPCYGGSDDLWGTQITFQDINRMAVLTQYLCGTEPRGRMVVEDVILRLYYRPWPLVQPGPMQ